MEVNGQLHSTATLPPGKEPLILIGRYKGKKKVKLPLCLTKQHIMKVYGGVGV
jgi:hypothetical protein